MMDLREHLRRGRIGRYISNRLKRNRSRSLDWVSVKPVRHFVTIYSRRCNVSFFFLVMVRNFHVLNEDESSFDTDR